MKYHILILVGLINRVYLDANHNNFLPNLPTGKYVLYFKAAFPCNKTINSKIQQNFYFNKVSTNATELRGNITMKIPFDDSLHFHMDMAVKDSIGGWKENFILFNAPKACSTFKNLYGNEWQYYLKNFGISHSNCPIMPGVYVSKGYDMQRVLTTKDIAHVFFYGTYKLRVYFKKHDENEQLGCVYYILECRRPWEAV